MKVCFIKTSHQEYTLECTREDGSTTSITLEARSYLKHDLVHLVLEKSARLSDSFYGIVAAGRALDSLTPKAMRDETKQTGGEIAATEIVVGALQGALNSTDTDPTEFVARLRAYLPLQQQAIPEYLSGELVVQVLGDVRTLMLRYDALKTGDRLCLQFP